MRDLSPWRRQIEDALAQGWQGHSFEDIERGVNEQEFQAWTSPGSVIITQVIVHPQYKQLFVFLAGGNLAEVEALAEDIIVWARLEGCTRAQFIGRPGWERTFLSRTGWHQLPVIYMEREI